ncbi:DUF6058 family natural product biosynthesis protein [bacterium]|nr:DUF6058 family natural product biosynthesis protein [bacterium]NUN45765.1 hypothetical protein [bacterium]
MKTDTQYIKENFIELKELSEKTGFSETEILELIEKEIIPNYSYSIEKQEIITSPLSDKLVNTKYEKYFSKSHIEKLNDYKNFKKKPEEIKETFKQNFVQNLKNHNENKFAYDNLFINKTEEIDRLLNEVFETEWKHYCNGIYGICTLNASEKEIVEKEIVIKKLIEFNQKYGNSTLNETNRDELLKLNEEFNQVTSLFAPYQRKTSSRGKYIDKLLKENNLNGLIKNYG